MVFGMNPIEFLDIEDPTESLVCQASLLAAERYTDTILDSLARKIRNQIAEMLKG